MSPRSIGARLALASLASSALVLALAWWGLSSLLAHFIDERLEAELEAALRGVLALSEWDETGRFDLAGSLADPRFEVPLSGWYWQVADGERVLARSPSLVTGDLGPRGTRLPGPDGAGLVARTRTFTAPGDGTLLHATVSLPESERHEALARIREPLAWALGFLLVILAGVQLFGMRTVLADIRRLRGDLNRLHLGETERLTGPYPVELRPLADEINGLIDTNRAIARRARSHAGNLAHALKTPLSVLLNRAGDGDAALLTRMERTIRWHLGRARAGASGDSLTARARVTQVLDDLALVLRPQAARRNLALEVACDEGLIFAGEPEDLLEIIGNLADNALAFAASVVRVQACAQEGPVFLIRVEDDGPGIPQAERALILARGARLDEERPGSGLGLAITSDLVALYGGSLALHAGGEGGLLAEVRLPAHLAGTAQGRPA